MISEPQAISIHFVTSNWAINITNHKTNHISGTSAIELVPYNWKSLNLTSSKKFFPQTILAKTSCHKPRISAFFDKNHSALLIQLKNSVNPPSPHVNVACLDSRDLLHDFFRVTEINNIDLGGKGGRLLFRSTFFRFVTRVLARIVWGRVSGCMHVWACLTGRKHK